jgi:hypothetical protein
MTAMKVEMDERLWVIAIRALKDLRVECRDFGYDNNDQDALDESIREIGEQTGLDPQET